MIFMRWKTERHLDAVLCSGARGGKDANWGMNLCITEKSFIKRVEGFCFTGLQAKNSSAPTLTIASLSKI